MAKSDDPSKLKSLINTIIQKRKSHVKSMAFLILKDADIPGLRQNRGIAL